MKAHDERDAVPNLGSSARAEMSSTLRIGTKTKRPSSVVPVQRFEDRGEIARGGMSSVRRVFDRLVMREVAMKELAPTRDFDELARFVEEVQVMGQLDHPNIVPVHDIEMDDQGLPTRFTMKLVGGETLGERIAAAGSARLSGERLEELLQVFLRVCDAIAFAHSRGVIHRDLKPSNIMVATHGQVYVMDWGVALLRESACSSEIARASRVRYAAEMLPEALGSLIGTPAYMAPEQARGEIEHIDERTDVYGLGGILYYLLTQRAPHEATSVDESLARAKRGEVKPPPEALDDGTVLPPLLCRIASRALAADPAARYANVGELKRDIEAFLRGGGWFAQQFFPAGTTIVREGDVADAAYIVSRGHCELHKLGDADASGTRASRFVCELGPGDVFGETAIFTSSTRTGTITAKSDVTALVVTRSALERELDRNQWLRAFVRAVAERCVDLDRQLSKRPNDSTR